MKILKKICFNIIIWVLGVAAFSWLLMWDLERNPIPQSPDGSIPDSAGIPIFVFALFFLILILFVNVVLWLKLKFFKKNVT